MTVYTALLQWKGTEFDALAHKSLTNYRILQKRKQEKVLQERAKEQLSKSGSENSQINSSDTKEGQPVKILGLKEI